MELGRVDEAVALCRSGVGHEDAPLAERMREVFIEGIDYYNDLATVPFEQPDDSIPVINWAAFNIVATEWPSSDFEDAVNYKAFTALNDQQKNAVLETLGYAPVYDFSYANPQEYKTIDGTPTVEVWTPEWAGNAKAV